MKAANEMTSTSKSNRQTTHSPRFEELAVVLPEHIVQPCLKQMAQRIQESMFQKPVFQEPAWAHKSDKKTAVNTLENKAAVNPRVAVNSKNKGTHKVENGFDVANAEISRVQTILEHLVNTPIADAAVLVLITNEEQPKLLLTRRAAHLNSHAGEVSFAGGKHDVGDGNNVVTALREACEETALPPSKAQIVGQLPPQTSKKGLAVRPIIALVEPPITYVPELGEIARIFWADFEKLITEPTSDYILPYNMDGKTINIKTPSWEVDGEVVWGLTGRILANLFEVCFDREVDWYYQPVES